MSRLSVAKGRFRLVKLLNAQLSVDVSCKMPVQASNRLFKLFSRTDRLEVYPYAYRLEVYRTDRACRFIRTLQAGCPTGQAGCPTGQVVLVEASLTVLLRYLYEYLAYLVLRSIFLLQVHPRKSVFPRNVVRSVQIPLTVCRKYDVILYTSDEVSWCSTYGKTNHSLL
jgi:hypothetical protein